MLSLVISLSSLKCLVHIVTSFGTRKDFLVAKAPQNTQRDKDDRSKAKAVPNANGLLPNAQDFFIPRLSKCIFSISAISSDCRHAKIKSSRSD